MIGLVRFRDGRDGDSTRRRILALIEAAPGTSMSALGHRLMLSRATVRHHVAILAQEGLVHVHTGGWSTEVYRADVPPTHVPWLRALRDERTETVFSALVSRPGQGVYALSDQLGWSRKVVRKHLSRLMDEGMVRRLGTARPRYVPEPAPADLRLPILEPANGNL